MSVRGTESVRVIGIWDLNTSPISLGGLLVLVEELKIWSEIRKCGAVSVCIFGDMADVFPPTYLPTNGRWISLVDSKTCKDCALLSMLLGMEGMEACYLFRSGTQLQAFLQQVSYPYITWPALTSEGSVSHEYGYTLFVQEYYRKNGHIPFLSCKVEALQWALKLIQKYVTPSIPVVVHLKNKLRRSGKPDWYNARFDEWGRFFETVRHRYDVKFLLIGNEPVPSELRVLPNVLVTKDLGSDLIKDLALVQVGYGFMGVASGPCQMAVFSEVPYVIYKNPEHHVQVMIREMGESDHFVFATPFQKLLRRFETRDSLLQEFERIYAHNPHMHWDDRPRNVKL